MEVTSYLPPEHNLVVMILGLIALSCLVLWLRLRRRPSQFLIAVCVLVLGALPSAIWLAVMFLSGSVNLQIAFYLSSLASAMYVSAVVWFSSRERPRSFREMLSSIGDLLLIVGAVVVPLVVVSFGVPPFAPATTSGILVLSWIFCLVLISAAAFRVSQQDVSVRKAALRAVCAMVDLVILLGAWDLLFRTATSGASRGFPGHFNPYYDSTILVYDFFILLAVVIVRLLLAVWRETTKQIGSMHVKQIDAARDLS